jgi:hypothetical protein
MPIYTLTLEKYAELKKKLAQKQKEREKVEKTKPIDYYKQDLIDLRNQIEKTHSK